MTFVQVAARSDCPSIWRNIAQISHAIDASTLLGMRVRARRHSTGESSKLSSFLITAKAALTTAPDNRSRAAPSVLSCSSAWIIDRFKRLNNGGYCGAWETRSEEHTSELQSLMRRSYAVFCLKK